MMVEWVTYGHLKKLPSCLTRSPEPPISGTGNAPAASYHQASPDVSLIEMPIRPSPTSTVLYKIPNLSLSRKRSWEPSPAPEPLAESPSPITIPTALLPPPATFLLRD